MEYNRHLKTIANVLLLTATQNIAQGVNQKSPDSKNKGNFWSILEEFSKHDPLIQKRTDAYGNAKCTSHLIQHEILPGLAQMVQGEIVKGKCSVLL